MSVTEHAQFLKSLPDPIYKFLSQSWIDTEFPRHLFIETCAQCNLKCPYCPREDNKGNMPWEMFTRIIDEATLYGKRSFSLHLFNEPFLYPRIFEAIEYIKKKNKRHTILLTTNGTTLNVHVDRLLKSDVDKVIWSWRPEAKFSEATKEKLRSWGKLTVRMIEETVPKEERDYWESWPSVEIRNLHNYGGEISLENFGAKPTVGSRWPCYHLWLAPAVAWNGNILVCCSDPHQKEVLGNLADMTVSEAWKKMDGIRKAHLRGEFTGICKDCDVWKNYPDLFFSWQKS